MKKVKEKVDKLKATIKHGGDHKDEAQTVNDSPVVRSGLAEPTVMGTPVLAEDLYATHSDIIDTPVRSFAQWEDEERHGAPPPLSTDYETRLTDQPHVGHHTYGQDVNREQLKGIIGKPTGLEDRRGESQLLSAGTYGTHPTDLSQVGRPAYGDQDVGREQQMGSGKSTGMEDTMYPRNTTTAVSPANVHSEVTDTSNTGGKEVGITDVLRSFDKMKVFNEHEAKSLESDQNEPTVYTGSHDQFAPEPVENPPLDTVAEDPSNRNSSYTQRISSATSAIAHKAAEVKDSIVSKLGSSSENKSDASTISPKTNKKSSFPTDLSHKVADTLSNTLGPVYEKVAGAEGVTVKEYLVDTFKPGDDDKVLSEAITHAFHRGKGNGQPQESSTTTYVIREEGERRVQDSGN
ncbi:hypothetical protein L1987_11789 [Smallanthus sonchifolius]|uniref:Uncharacterized protein n=1 Tax=Smallanthus sonchifolius TaxID=185202 RepID=A0ACB9JCB4_9ASTR|nr:hypothetical protein L1987_11789 [Smallanthus sonchifolius]